MGCEWPRNSACFELLTLQSSESNETNWFDWSSETIPSTTSSFALAGDIETGFLSFVRDQIEKLLDSLVSKLSTLSSWTSNFTSRFAGLIKSLLKIQANYQFTFVFRTCNVQIRFVANDGWKILASCCLIILIILFYFFLNFVLYFLFQSINFIRKSGTAFNRTQNTWTKISII